MTSKNLTIAGILATSLASADVSISVQHDATYSLSESHGLSCSGNGAKPAGTQCPKAGDLAIADCKPYLLSYSGTRCVAPVDAECVLVINDTWGCAFPQTADAETSKAYTGKGANYDKTRDAPLDVNCDVVSDETKPGKYGHMAIGTNDHMTSKGSKDDHMTTDTAESANYGSKIHTTERGETTGHDEPSVTKNDSMRNSKPSVTFDGMTRHHEDNGHDENTKALAEESSSYPSKDVTGNYRTEASESAYPTEETSDAYPAKDARSTEETVAAGPNKETLQTYPTEIPSDTQRGHGTAEAPIIATKLGGTTGPGDTAAGDDSTALGNLTETPVDPSAYTTETSVSTSAYPTLALASQ
ncbi:unnamed protein product [Peronospora destructor]|uniref:Carbohydrate-binding module family 19 domain-containing protein n=1 Tax=Peronospora destructor TaxID=86335 RepID=A0AAV0VK45_9STRA|nr:unnamed protein product [Peronospora destructor]